MLVSAQNITKRFSTHTALDSVSLEIPEGKIYGLLGPNGAGKTTFIRILNQMIQPDEGHILINGNPLRDSDVEKIGYLPEERGLYKKMRVREQILYFASLKGMSEQAARQDHGTTAPVPHSPSSLNIARCGYTPDMQGGELRVVS